MTSREWFEEFSSWATVLLLAVVGWVLLCVFMQADPVDVYQRSEIGRALTAAADAARGGR